MIDDDLLERDSLEDDEWSITPKPGHLIPDSVERRQIREAFTSKLERGPDAIVLTHTDADGLSSAALIAHDYGTATTTVQPLDYHGAYQFDHALEDLHEFGIFDTPIYVTDFALDSADDHTIGLLGSLANARNCPITWYDHHQWDDDVVEALEWADVDVVIDEDECAASLICRERGPFNDRLEDLAGVTKDIDLWIRDDPRSGRLNVFATIAETSEYIGTVLDHGPDLPEHIQDRIDDRLKEDEYLEQKAVKTASFTIVDDYEIALTYSRGGRSSEIGNTLCEDESHHFDIAMVMKPHGGMGIYSHSNRETFDRCHEIAKELGGGGHPTAAGCSVPVETFRELAEYWATAGGSVHGELHDALQSVLLEDEDDGDDRTVLSDGGVDPIVLMAELARGEIYYTPVPDGGLAMVVDGVLGISTEKGEFAQEQYQYDLEAGIVERVRLSETSESVAGRLREFRAGGEPDDEYLPIVGGGD